MSANANQSSGGKFHGVYDDYHYYDQRAEVAARISEWDAQQFAKDRRRVWGRS